MSRPKQADQRDDMAQRIKDVARHQMQANGTAGLSLRAIARELGITAPAIYNYYPRLDDLITALIVDAFHAIAEAATHCAHRAGTEHRQRLVGWLHGIRQWALENPTDFDLIYGNAIPGYNAPQEVTVPAAEKLLRSILELMMPAHASGEVHLPPAPVPAENLGHLQNLIAADGHNVPPELLFHIYMAWAKFHGAIMLEKHGHLAPVVGDPDTAYAYLVEELLRDFGIA